MSANQSLVCTPVVRAYAKSTEAWKEEHPHAVHCLNVEGAIRMGNFLYDDLRECDETWRLEYARGNCRNYFEEMERCFELWLRPAPIILRWIEELEANGYEVEGAEGFRGRVKQARDAQNW